MINVSKLISSSVELSGTPFDESIGQDESDMMRNDAFRIEPAISGDRHEGTKEKASVGLYPELTACGRVRVGVRTLNSHLERYLSLSEGT